ncbi:MAG: hypothetical protein WC596_01715 [Candidatus Shapirobacteria bacterium]
MDTRSKVFLSLIAILFTSTLYLLFLNFNKTPATIFTPQIGIVPTKNSTPTAVSTNNWKTYTNDFGGFSLLYPSSLEVNEKNISTKEKQINFNSQLGNKFSIAIATSDINPGWGGGCGPDDMGKVNLLGELKSTCINNEGLWAFYFSNINNSKEFSLSSTFGKDLTKENVLKILSTFKFTSNELQKIMTSDKCVSVTVSKPMDTTLSLNDFIKNTYNLNSDITLYKIQYKVGNYSSITIPAMNIEEISNTYVKVGNSIVWITVEVNIPEGPPKCKLNHDQDLKTIIENITL